MKKFAKPKVVVTLFSKVDEEVPKDDMIDATILDDPEDIYVDVTSDGLIRVSAYVGCGTACKVFECPCHNEFAVSRQILDPK